MKGEERRGEESTVVSTISIVSIAMTISLKILLHWGQLN